MKKMRLTLRFLLAAGALTFCLSACGGSGSSTSSAASSTSKTVSWTNVNIRALDGMININWDKAAGSALGASVPTYNIYCSNVPTDIVQDKNRIATNYEGQSFDYTGLPNDGTRYYCAVTQVTAAGEGPPSLTVSATPQAVQPAAPNGLKVTAPFSNISSVKLEFMGPAPSNPANVTYNLYRSTTRDVFTSNDIIATPSFTTKPIYSDTDPKLVKDGKTTYYYAVKAVVAGKESAFSPVVSARPQAKVAAVDNTLPLNQLASFASPTDMSVEPGNGSCIVRWTDVAPLVISGTDTASTTPDYILYWSGTADISPDLNDGHIDNVTRDVTSGGFKLTGLTNGKTYYLQLVAAVKDTNGKPILGRFTPGSVVSVTPAATTPAVPSGVSATQGPQQVSLTWNKDTSGLPGITFNIYYSTTDAASPAELMAKAVKVMPSSKAYFTHSGLDAGKTYYYVVTSVGEGESAPSNIISVTVPL